MVTGMPIRKINSCLILSAVLSTGVVFAQGAGQEKDVTPDDLALDRESVRCISSGAIRATDAIDDNTIVFRMRNGDYFMNVLISGCDSLERRNRFSYSTPSGRLCSGNMISVIRGASPASASSAVGCGLQRFFPITDVEAELLGVDEVRRRGQSQIDVENPNEDEEEDEE